MDRRKFILGSTSALTGGFLLPGIAGSAAAQELPAGAVASGILDALPGKRPLLKRSFRPPNYETPVSYFREAFTPNDAFYRLDTAADGSRIDADLAGLGCSVDGPGPVILLRFTGETPGQSPLLCADLILRAEATGAVEPVRKVEVKSKASGEILTLYVDVGDVVTFTLTASNLLGPDAAPNVVVQDQLPAGYSYVAGSIAGGDSRSDASAPTLSWNITSLGVGGGSAVALTFRAAVVAGQARASSPAPPETPIKSLSPFSIIL